MSKSIRVDEETHAALSALKREDETYDDVLSRLLEKRREAVAEGAGLWDESDAATAARKARRARRGASGSDPLRQQCPHRLPRGRLDGS